MPMKFLRSAMRKSRKEKPPSLHIPRSSRESSPCSSAVHSDWDADDEGFMSSSDLPSRPLSVALPGGYGTRRPTLQDVLANRAPSPWTLSAFTAFLSQNHCLETLEFTTDATRYKKQYVATLEGDADIPTSRSNETMEYMRMLWQKLMDAYIRPSAPREVNLPSNVRDLLLALPNTDQPPKPSNLDDAVRKIYQLMDDSVLGQFLDSMPAIRGSQGFSPWASSEDVPESRQIVSASFDPRTVSPQRVRVRRSQSPPNGFAPSDNIISSRSPPQRISQQSHLSAALNRNSRSSAAFSNADLQDANLTDDSASSLSPTNSSLEPTTPPTTPPTSDADFGTSPKNIRGDGSGWKKMGAKLGWKKSRTLSGSNSTNISGRYPMRMGRENAVEEEDDSAL